MISLLRSKAALATIILASVTSLPSAQAGPSIFGQGLQAFSNCGLAWTGHDSQLLKNSFGAQARGLVANALVNPNTRNFQLANAADGLPVAFKIEPINGDFENPNLNKGFNDASYMFATTSPVTKLTHANSGVSLGRSDGLYANGNQPLLSMLDATFFGLVSTTSKISTAKKLNLMRRSLVALAVAAQVQFAIPWTEMIESVSGYNLPILTPESTSQLIEAMSPKIQEMLAAYQKDGWNGLVGVLGLGGILFATGADHFVNRQTFATPVTDDVVEQMIFSMNGRQWLRDLHDKFFAGIPIAGRFNGLTSRAISLLGSGIDYLPVVRRALRNSRSYSFAYFPSGTSELDAEKVMERLNTQLSGRFRIQRFESAEDVAAELRKP